MKTSTSTYYKHIKTNLSDKRRIKDDEYENHASFRDIQTKFQLQVAQNRDNARLTLDLHNFEVLYAQVENSIGDIKAQEQFEQIQAEYEKVIAFEKIKRELFQIDKDDVSLKHIYTNCNDPLINTLSVWGWIFFLLQSLTCLQLEFFA